MAPAKRKRRATGTTAKKRAKIVETSDPEPEPTTSQEWAAECILKERRRGRKIQYLVEWKDIDPATGTRYEPTWEPEENANEELLESWLEEKAKARTRSRSVQTRRTIESSPATSSIPVSTVQSTVPSPSIAPAPAPARPNPSPHVPIVRRGSSLNRAEFDYHSQFATSQPEALRPRSQETDLDSSQLFAANSPQSMFGLVPNSQSSAGEATFVPATQETTGTTTQDTDSSVLEDAEQDPGTAEVIEAASPRASPARSIPETICDTTGETDSQSQHRQVEPQDVIEISSSSSTSSAPESPVVGAAQRVAQAEIDNTEIQSIALEQNRQNHNDIAGQKSLVTFAESNKWLLANQKGAGRCQDSLKQTSVPGNPDVPPSVHHHQPEGTQNPAQASLATIKHITNVTGNARTDQSGADSAVASEVYKCANTIASPVRENPSQPTENQNQELAVFGLQAPSTNSSVENVHNSNPSDQRSWPRPTEDYADSQEQHAQVVRVESHISTQNDSYERPPIPLSIEKDRSSRHDSSQETSDELQPSESSSSGIASPPRSSFGALGSYLPSRPETPAPRFSYSMTSEWSAERIERKLREELDRKKAENPFNLDQNPPSYTSPSAVSAAPDRSNAANAGPLPGFLPQEADGTRSPSIIPDHSPVPQAPTSLRTIALSQSALLRANRDQQEPADDVMDESSGTSGYNSLDKNTVSIPAIVTTESKMPEGSSSSGEGLSDAEDDEGASLLNDDLQLSVEEYVVPLFIEGRQSDTYTSYVKHNKDMLHSFLSDPKSFSSLSNLEEVLSHLRALETHFDLVYAEAGLTSSGIGASTQIQFAAQFGVENSIKFKFLKRLFQELKAYDKHVMLVIDSDNNDLLEILDNFCKATSVNYNMPTIGSRADENGDQSTLLITIFPSDTKEAITGAADLIICLDGVQDAAQIRRKSWASNPKIDNVPILHLVIPRTVGHIERYLSSSLKMRTRIHTTIASLSQLIGELGSPINDDTPHADVAAELVAEWLTATPEDRGEWPLVSIGSVKDLVQFQTQFAEASSPAPERTKRPHDDETFDPAKRMRLTPQPQDAVASGQTLDNEVTRISDSMPGTAIESSTQLRQQIKELEIKFQSERKARNAEAAQFREYEAMWTQQQTIHENLTIKHRQLHKENEKLQEQLGRVTSNLEKLREHNAQLTTEKRSLVEQLEQQRATDMLSSDDKTTELTRIRAELSKANEEKARALRSAESADKMAEYVKEQYRNAQDIAAQAQASIVELEARIEKLQVAASGQPAKLKALHLDRQHESQSKQIKALRAENAHLKRSLGQREEELQRAKMSGGRMGVGTRATSATPQPKVRSRAASPMGGRLSNLRNG